MSSSAPQLQKQRGQCHVDDDQRGGDERHLAAEQAEAAIDIAGEYAEELVDDAGAAHGSSRLAMVSIAPLDVRRLDPILWTAAREEHWTREVFRLPSVN